MGDIRLDRGKMVARYADGRLVKGYSYDFHPGRPVFHVFPVADPSLEPIRVPIRDLKAVFWVRDFVGNGRYNERKRFVEGQRAPGRKVEITFADGEVLVGSTVGSREEELGFFFVPADPRCNNLKLFAVSAAVRGVRPLPEQPAARHRSPPASPQPPLALPRRLLAWLSRSGPDRHPHAGAN